MRVVAQHHGAVVDAHFGERGGGACASGFWLRASASISAGPIGVAVGVEIDGDGRPLERHVGDLDAADQQREKAQPRGQPLGGQRRLAGVAEHDVVEADAAGRKQPDTSSRRAGSDRGR